ncbi:EmrB/QacA subfamily drug resistance transporter [Kitasatospora sp. MAP12-15]|uniref:MFS transporter n=1 Tax=unclassified Kitasatospora TaxID=2633591 RepID=UPI0024743B08|nr:MFS transporter [Kitasatospora sp. MAP12-44]MDH6112441.1 EmrB/QacA subfamily drug resistance transporter [Kitasatospora sp. MAP12-44]
MSTAQVATDPPADSLTPAAPAGRAASGGRWWTLGIVSIATFMLMLDLTVVNVALPDLRTSLGADFSALQWVLDAYALTLAAFLLTGGSLADRLGRKRVYGVGFAIFTAASLACGAAQGIVALNVARGVQGVGAAVLFAVGPALIGQEFRGKDRAMAFGVFGGVSGLAIAFGPLIGGALTDGIGWRWIFLVNVPIGIAAMVLGALRISESRDPSAHRVDWAGLVVFSAALTLLVLGFLRGENQGWASAPIVGMFVGAAVLLVLFALIERRLGEAAMLDLGLFRNVTFIGISVTTLLANAAGMSAIFLQVSYMQNVLGFSPLATGVRFLPLTLTLFVAAAVTGSLTVKVPQRLLVGIGTGLIAGGLFLITLVHPSSSWTAMLPSMLVTGLGMGMFNPPRSSLAIGVAEPAKAGMAAGIGETFQQVGIAVGIAGFGALFQHRVADAFATSPAGAQLGAQARQAGKAVAAGAGNQLATTVPSALSGAVRSAAREAFVHGLSDVLVAGGAVAAVGAVVGFLFIRTRDLHESALAGAEGGGH